MFFCSETLQNDGNNRTTNEHCLSETQDDECDLWEIGFTASSEIAFTSFCRVGLAMLAIQRITELYVDISGILLVRCNGHASCYHFTCAYS